MSRTAAGWDERHLAEEPTVRAGAISGYTCLPTNDGLMTTPVNSL